MTQTIFEKSQEGQSAFSLPKEEEVWSHFNPSEPLLRKAALPLPEVSEIDLTRHYSRLAKKNMGIDTHFYPLGSCTMKLNPRVNELCASWEAFLCAHPLAPEESVQGHLQIMEELMQWLLAICGMDAGTLQPNAGAQGEFVGMQMIAAYHKARGDIQRKEVLVPDNAHGTNPATAAMCGFTTVAVRTNHEGDLDQEHLKALVSDKTAALMLTNPNTLGLFSSSILEVSERVHKSGGLLYYDGANLNAIMNIARPKSMGFDVLHLNLHKTFSTPHGGGGPGAGPVLCTERLQEYLPTPFLIGDKGNWKFHEGPTQSIGRIASFHGNFAVCLRAYLYIKLHGHFGLRRVAEMAVLNANYLKARLSSLFTLPFLRTCMHEFVVQADRFLSQDITAYDLVKRLLDYGFHPPTVYFPLIVKECLLIEPTEVESKATLDAFYEAFEKIVEEAKATPEHVRGAPHTLSVKRLDEVRAARDPILTHVLESVRRI